LKTAIYALSNSSLRSKTKFSALIVIAISLFANITFAGLNNDLITAAENGDLENVQKLLARGSNVNAKDNHGWTALRAASTSGNLDVVIVLIKKWVYR
jgi:uncharacterized protein